jgi:hypothetical protein
MKGERVRVNLRKNVWVMRQRPRGDNMKKGDKLPKMRKRKDVWITKTTDNTAAICVIRSTKGWVVMIVVFDER